MHIRKATVTDLEKLLPLFLAYRVFYLQPLVEEEVRKFLLESLSNPDNIIFIAVDENTHDNFLGFTKLNLGWCSLAMSKYWILYDLYINEAVRKSSIASKLLAHIEAFAIETGACRIELQTANDNIPAQSLYHKHGYEKETHFLSYVRVLPTPTNQKKIEILAATTFQKQIWHDQQLVPQDLKYNIVSLFRLAGRVNIEALNIALSQLVQHNPAFRTRFDKKGEQLFQVINENNTLVLDVCDLSEQTKEKIDEILQTKARHHFQLDKFPLAVVCLIKYQPTNYYLLFNFHHIIIDGPSIDRALRLFALLYHCAMNKQQLHLPHNASLMHEYLGYEQQQNLLDKKQTAKMFWQQQLQHAPRKISFIEANAKITVKEDNTTLF
jgi:ribosomal protein S18 acetylase RimI-like enzyme